MSGGEHQALAHRRRRGGAHRRGECLRGQHLDAAAGRHGRVRAAVRLAAAALRHAGRPDDDVLPGLRAALARQDRDDRHLHRRRPQARVRRLLQPADELPRGPARRRIPAGASQRRAVHAPALRSCRLEHAAWWTASGCRPSRRRATCSAAASAQHWKHLRDTGGYHDVEHLHDSIDPVDGGRTGRLHRSGLSRSPTRCRCSRHRGIRPATSACSSARAARRP